MQRYRTVIILILLVVLPLAAALIAARFLLLGNEAKPVLTEVEPVVAAAPPEKPEKRLVLAAARGLPVGTLLREEDLIEIEFKAGEVRRGHVVVDGPAAVDALRGHALREAVAAGEPLTRSAVVGPGQRGFLAAVLKRGTRAVTIRLGAGARHAGLIDPGDRVDVILTAKLRLADGAQGVFTRTILEDVRVVAVDRRVGSGTESSKGSEQVKRSEIVTATLEVSPAQADRLAHGANEGKLSVAVRSLVAAARQEDSKAVDLEELLSLPAAQETEVEPVVAAAPPEKPEKRLVLAAARGLPVGTLLREEDLIEIEFKAGEVRRGHVVVDGPAAVDALRGHALREAVAAGEPLTRSAVVGPGQRGFLAAVLKRGTRAVTIRLGAGARHAGLIDPGDRVDVILTAKLRLADGAQGVFTRTILEDVRVVAVDRRVGSGTESSKGSEQVKRSEIVTATLEVSPAQADRLAHGANEGKLSVAVRSLVAAARQEDSKAVDLEELLSLPAAQETEVEPVVAAAPPEKPEKRLVLAAARGLPVGTLLREEDLIEIEFKAGEVRRGHVVVDGPAAVDALRGHALREAVAAGEPLTRSAVVGPGQRGFLAAVLKRGTRAVTIRLGAGARHAGLIDPGDRVDVILTAKLRLADGAQGVFTRTILEDVRVVAVDRRVGSGTESSKGSEQVKRSEIVTATLEVSPAQADRLAHGANEGKLSVAVRSLVAAARQEDSKAVDLEELLSLPAAQETEVEPVVAAAPPEKPEKRLVLAAARGLPVGTLLREEDLIEIEFKAGEVRRGHVVVDGPAAVDALRGHALREAVAAGEPLTRSAVVGPGQRGFLAAVLKRGTRAVTIRLGAGARHAGLIDPGDRVDVILTAKLRLADGAQGVFTRTILEDVRVVAVDRRVGSGTESSKGSEQVKRSEIVTATLEVSPAQADRLAHGANEGKLSVAVRSLVAAARQEDSKAVDLEELLSLPAAQETEVEPVVAAAPPEKLPVTATESSLDQVKKVRVIRGDKITDQTFPDPLRPFGTESSQ